MNQINNKNTNRKKSKLFILFSIFLFTAIFSGVCVVAFAQCEVGSAAPDFSLQSLDGQTYQLSQFKNQQDFILLTFIKGDDPDAIGKLTKITGFLNDCQPQKSYQVISIMTSPQIGEELKDQLIGFQQQQKQIGVPLLILIEDGDKVLEDYRINGYPAMVLLKYDLSVMKLYPKFTTRQEKMFYQYLNFILSCKKEDKSSGCNGVCPPPPGY